MFQQKQKLFVLFLLLALMFKGRAQIIASTTVGCVPLSVSYSGPAGASSIMWNLGAGIGTSTLTNPNPIYNNAGTYNITYTAIVNGNPQNYSLQILAHPAPNASFSFSIPPTHCIPMSVSFSGSGGSPGSTYNWAFGDLSSSIGVGPLVSHTYAIAGSLLPVMTVVDAVTGCTASAMSGTIHVSSPPQVFVSSSQGFVGCSAPFVTSLSGSLSASGSPIVGPLTVFNWSMPGANPSSASGVNVGNVGFGNGQYSVSLTVTDNNLCSNTGTYQVSVSSPSLVVTIAPTVCLNSAFNIIVSSNQTAIQWNFSSGNITSTVTPITPNASVLVSTGHYFTAGGVQSYTASVSAGSGCPNVSTSGIVFVESVVADFTIAPNVPHSTCHGVLPVSYINLSTINSSAVLSFTWLSGTDLKAYNHIAPSVTITSSTSVSPTFTLSQGSNNPYTKFTQHIPSIKLMVESNSAAHCAAIVQKTNLDTIRVLPPGLIKIKVKVVHLSQLCFAIPASQVLITP